ncbi:MAG: Arc family DNA-binding protein [Spirochaetales bacterium]|nr:Arc family DNA-binding protein [Spirochaetales bacterium]
MAALNIKSIPENLYKELKKSAKIHHRSINSEVIAILEPVLMHTKVSKEQHLRYAADTRSRVKPGTITIQDITNAIHEGRP